jgi:hypothetical protein
MFRNDVDDGGDLTFSPTWPMFPSGLNCLPMAPADEMTEGF